MRRERTYANNAEYILQHLAAHWLRLPSDSRIKRQCNLMMQGEVITPTSPSFEMAREGVRDLQVLGFILEQEEGHDDPEFRRLAQIMLKDAVLPQDNKGNTKGRDAQFELFVTAVCRAARMDPVVREEPDVTCRTGGMTFAIAVKRAKTPNALLERLKEAANQLGRSKWRGVIAVETVLAFNPENGRVCVPIPDGKFGESYRKAVTTKVEEMHQAIRNAVGNGALGVVIHDSLVRLDPDGHWSLAGMSMSIKTRDHPGWHQEFNVFWEAYRQGLPNWQPV